MSIIVSDKLCDVGVDGGFSCLHEKSGRSWLQNTGQEAEYLIRKTQA